MRLLLLVGALGLVPSAAAFQGGLAVAVSSNQAAARPVRLSLTTETRLQCGSAAGAPWHITLPAAEQVPHTIAPTDVLVNGHAASKVDVGGSQISVTLPRPHVLCDVIAPAKVVFVFTSAARLGNPRHGGTYFMTLARGRFSARGMLRIRG